MVTVSNVVNASKGELLCITYELLLEQIELAKKSDVLEERKQHSKKAIKIIQMLAGDLDFNIEIAHDLFKIYVYVQGVLINAKTDEAFDEAYKLIHKIYSSYKQIVQEEDVKEPVMQNAEMVYAGLTYGKGSINETIVQGDNRGFKA